jgi:hypothetical protein
MVCLNWYVVENLGRLEDLNFKHNGSPFMLHCTKNAVKQNELNNIFKDNSDNQTNTSAQNKVC